MCTIGATRLADEDYLIFKNKDFPRASFEDQLVVEEDVFGIAGVATWSEPDPAADRFSGISAGANVAGLLCADANVRGASGLSNYDELVEIALRAGGGVAAGIAAIRDAVAARPYLWANIVMIDEATAAAVEVRSEEVSVDQIVSAPIARSNHHLMFGRSEEVAPNPTSEERLFAAQARLGRVEQLVDVLALQRAHDAGESGVCNHIGSQTVYSYVLQRRGDETSLYVTRGHPCVAEEVVELVVPLGERWSPAAASDFSEEYPSNRANLSG